MVNHLHHIVFLPFHNRIHFYASFFPQLWYVSCLHHSRLKHNSFILSLYLCWHAALILCFKMIFHSCDFLILNDKKEIIYLISFILLYNAMCSTMFQSLLSPSQVCSLTASYINNFSIRYAIDCFGHSWKDYVMFLLPPLWEVRNKYSSIIKQ